MDIRQLTILAKDAAYNMAFATPENQDALSEIALVAAQNAESEAARLQKEIDAGQGPGWSAATKRRKLGWVADAQEVVAFARYMADHPREHPEWDNYNGPTTPRR